MTYSNFKLNQRKQKFIIGFLAIFILITTLPACLKHPNGKISFSRYANLNVSGLNGLDIHYKIIGRGAETIFFIHGWSCDSTVWRFQVPAFERNYRVILADLPGHGLSEKPQVPYTIEFFADAVKAVLDDAGIKKAILVGHSMGFPVAREFLKKYPKRAAALCIVDGLYFRVPKEPEKLAEWRKENEAFLQRFKGDGRKEFMGQFVDGLFISESPQELKNEIKAKMLGAPEYVANSAMEEIFNTENWQEFQVNIPTLAIYAVSPDLPPDNEKYLKSLFPILEYHEWEDAGHFLMMEHPERFNTMLLDFLKKHF